MLVYGLSIIGGESMAGLNSLWPVELGRFVTVIEALGLVDWTLPMLMVVVKKGT